MIIILQDRKIKICDEVIKLIKPYIQHKSDNESGGILIGRENLSNENLIIEFATEPKPKDKCGRSFFKRRDKFHIEYYNNLYKESKGTYRYIGEWHTHPELIPNYSSIDKKNWNMIGRQAKNQKNQIHLIVGQDAIRFWEYCANSKTANLIATICWSEISE